jgi:preprotein translocase subunit SecA
MDYLREGIHLRGFAQIEPIVAYKNEGFTLFTDLMNSIWSDFARMIFHIEVELETDDPAAGAQQYQPGAGSSSTGGASRVSYSSGAAAGAAAIAGAYGEGAPEVYDEAGNGGEPEGGFVAVEQRHVDERDQIGRNDPCWCGSGKKFKKCHGS